MYPYRPFGSYCALILVVFTLPTCIKTFVSINISFLPCNISPLTSYKFFFIVLNLFTVNVHIGTCLRKLFIVGT